MQVRPFPSLRSRRTWPARTILAGTAAVLVAVVGAPQPVHAEITNMTGPIIRSLPLPDVTPGAAEDDSTIRVFQERSQQTLLAPLTVDANAAGLYDSTADLPAVKPQIAAGTSVDSYLLHADAVGEPMVGPKIGGDDGAQVRIGFDQDILGVMMTSATLVAGDVQVGAPGTVYLDGPLGKRGLELDAKDSVNWIDARTIQVAFNINTVVDEVRVVTAAGVPGPGGGGSGGGGSGGGGSGGGGSGSTPGAPSLEIASGYRFVASDGGVFTYGNRAFFGSTGAMTLNQPIVAGSETSTGRGYWLIARDGGVFTFGDAKFHGSTGGQKLTQPIAGAATPSGKGYWLVAADGGIFNYGEAGFHGSTGAIKLNQPIVGMAPTPSGRGYWLVARDGGIFTFGDAKFYGSTGSIKLNKPIVAMQTTPSAQGYWLVAADGGVFSFGDAKFLGSTGAITLAKPIVGVL